MSKHTPEPWGSMDIDKAWDTFSVISKLIEAAGILLHDKDYDGHGWEEIEICHKRGLEILQKIRPIQAPNRDEVIAKAKELGLTDAEIEVLGGVK